MPLVEQLFCGQKFQAKKTPLGRRGVRVIVVVANLVSATAFGLWWIIVILVTGLIIIVDFYSSYDPFLLASIVCIRLRISPASQKPFCAHVITSKTRANL
jgi:hypothetical protein